MRWDAPALLQRATSEIAALDGVAKVELSEDDTIVVHMVNDPELKEAVLGISQGHMAAVAFVEAEGYSPLQVAGALGAPVEVPLELVAREVDGAQRLKRIRGTTRGRPVIAWEHGTQQVRQGTKVKFSKEACLQWTMGRTLTVKPGAAAMVKELSSRRPIIFVSIGNYDDVELPVHMMGHNFDVDTSEDPVAESVGIIPEDIKRLFGI